MGIEKEFSQGLSNPLAVRAHDLVKCYREVKAVDGLSLEIKPGECFGLLGPNGAGKTTTVEMLEGLIPPDRGEIEILGQRWQRGGNAHLKSRLGVQLQETRLAEKLTVRETLRLFSSFYRHGRGMNELLDLLELGEKSDALVGKLSGGQKQRLALACALAGNPELIFLDEPTTGLDPQVRRHIWEIIEGFRHRGGTVFLTTHYMEEAARLCDRVAIMDHGKIISSGTPAELIAALKADQIVELVATSSIQPTIWQDVPGVRNCLSHGDNGWRLAVYDMAKALPAIMAMLKKSDIHLLSLTTHQTTLEDVFIALTGRELRDG